MPMIKAVRIEGYVHTKIIMQRFVVELHNEFKIVDEVIIRTGIHSMLSHGIDRQPNC